MNACCVQVFSITAQGSSTPRGKTPAKYIAITEALPPPAPKREPIRNSSRSSTEALARVVALCQEIKEPQGPPPRPRAEARSSPFMAAHFNKGLGTAHKQTLQCSDITASSLQLLLEALGEQIKRVEGKSKRMLQMYPSSLKDREASAKERIERCQQMRTNELPDLALSLQRHEVLLQNTQSSIRQTRIQVSQLGGSMAADGTSESDQRMEQIEAALASLIENLASLESTTRSMLLLIKAMEGELDESYTHLSQQQKPQLAQQSQQSIPPPRLPQPHGSPKGKTVTEQVPSGQMPGAAPSHAHQPPPESPPSSNPPSTVIASGWPGVESTTVCLRSCLRSPEQPCPKRSRDG